MIEGENQVQFFFPVHILQRDIYFPIPYFNVFVRAPHSTLRKSDQSVAICVGRFEC